VRFLGVSGQDGKPTYREKVKHGKERLWTIVILEHVACCADGDKGCNIKECRSEHTEKKKRVTGTQCAKE